MTPAEAQAIVTRARELGERVAAIQTTAEKTARVIAAVAAAHYQTRPSGS